MTCYPRLHQIISLVITTKYLVIVEITTHLNKYRHYDHYFFYFPDFTLLCLPVGWKVIVTKVKNSAEFDAGYVKSYYFLRASFKI